MERGSQAGLWQGKGEKAKRGARVNFTVSFFISMVSWFGKAFLGRICFL